MAIDGFTYDGQTYGLPYAIENVALVRNTDLVPDVPATFEEMIQIATDFKAEHADDPSYQGLAVQVGPEGDAYHLQPILSAFGGYIFGQNEDGTYNPDDLGIDSEGGLASGDVPAGAGGGRSAQCRRHLRRDDRVVRLRQRPVRHHRPVGAHRRQTTGSRRPACRMRSAPFRPARAARPRLLFVGVQGFMISSFSEQKDLATSFVLDYMSQEASQLALFEAGGRPPALTSALEQVAYDPDIAGFGEAGIERDPVAGDPGDERRVGHAGSRRGEHAARR